jgi:hypothetical protein
MERFATSPGKIVAEQNGILRYMKIKVFSF